MNRKPFQFKQFKIYHDRCSMRVGTDGVLLGAWANLSNTQSILDIGTGTGLIAIMAAQRNEIAKIDAVEIEDNAFEQALENITKCNWNERISVHHQSIQNFSVSTKTQYDIIISNPPFFLAGSKSDNHARNLARHAHSLTQNDLLEAVQKLLSPEGIFAVILPINEGLDFIEIAVKFSLFVNRLTHVKPKINKPFERLLIEFSRIKKERIENKLIIQYDNRNHYTPDYVDLTKQFYAIM